jgi:hypothetical protein
MELVRASSRREWMDRTLRKTAYHCLPMVMANQAGWFLLSGHTIKVRWSGEDALDAVTIYVTEGSEPYPASSTFGRGIVTFHIPYLFRTPPGYNLAVRGPANWPRDGAYPLEGLVETDWSPATFTVNWQITRPDHTVVFKRGDPIAMLTPQRRGELELFSPVVQDLADDPPIDRKYQEWARSRRQFIGTTHVLPAVAWQDHYLRGVEPDGSNAPEHQKVLHLQPFRDLTAETKAADGAD